MLFAKILKKTPWIQGTKETFPCLRLYFYPQRYPSAVTLFYISPPTTVRNRTLYFLLVMDLMKFKSWHMRYLIIDQNFLLKRDVFTEAMNSPQQFFGRKLQK